MAITPGHATAQQKHGDVNGDGAVSALDAQAVLSGVVGIQLPGNFVFANGVAKCDHAVPMALDAQIILSYVIGLNVSQYCVGQSFGPGAVTVDIVPKDSSLLINGRMAMKATLKDNNGFLLTGTRPLAWSSSNPAIVTIDSVKGDSLAFVRASANQGSSTITATADGASFITQLKVFLSYAGIVITPQRPDTIRQLMSTSPVTFTSRMRDSLGALIGGANTIRWTITDTTVAGFAGTPTLTNANVVGKAVGTTLLWAVNQSNPADSTSVRLVVELPPVNTCVAGTGSVHNGANYTSDQHWTAASNPHFVNGGVQFSNNADLTIDPGVLVCMNGSASMTFNSGSRLLARGTVGAPVRFTRATAGSTWNTLQFGSVFGYTGTTTDTSVITNALLEFGGNSSPMVDGRERHTVILDSVQLRQAAFGLARVNGPGSRVSRSTLDTVTYSGTSPAAYVGRGSIEQTTIHNGDFGAGIQLTDAGFVTSSSIIGGTQGLTMACCTGGATLNDVSIAGTSSIAVDLQSANVALASRNVRISSSAGGAFRGTIGNLAILFPDSLAQETLRNNGKDTLFVSGGTMKNTAVYARADLPWVVTNDITVDTLSVLRIAPASTMQFSFAGLRVRNSGRLIARGGAGRQIVFRRLGSASFRGLVFENPPLPGGSLPPPPPMDTSYLVNVLVDSSSAGFCGQLACSAVSSFDRHVLVIDSARIRQTSSNGGVTLAAPGSRISRSVIDTTGVPTSSWAALVLGPGTLAETTTVRRSGQNGVSVQGAGVRLRGMQILNSVSYGLETAGGSLQGDSAGVTLTGNGYPFRGYVDDFALIARDTVAQLRLLGNVNDTLVMLGGTSRPFRGRLATQTLDTLHSMKALPWRVEDVILIDSLARFVPHPGSRFIFVNGSFQFQKGGRLIARGTPTDSIHFLRGSSGSFYGLAFLNPYQPSGAFPPPTPIDTSVLVRVRVSDVNTWSACTANACGAIMANDRHVLVVDSSRIRQSAIAAVVLNAPNSRISRTIIDTTGTPTASWAALVLGSNTLAETTTVRRSGQTGVYVVGTAARLRGINIVNGVSYGLDASGGTVIGDSAGVTITGNAAPFRGYVDNFGILARDTVAQLKWVGNVSDTIVMLGGTSRPFQGKLAAQTVDTLHSMKALPWRVEDVVFVDSLARFVPNPGSRFEFNNGSFQFQRGGRLIARGTTTDSIHFERWAGGTGSFYGLSFLNPYQPSGAFPPPAPIDTSVFVRARISGANTWSTCVANACGAVMANDRHVLVIDSVRIRQSAMSAVVMNAPNSRLSRTVIDTTGAPTASWAAVVLGSNALAESTTVRRSGQTGIYVIGANARLRGLQILNSVGVGLDASGGRLVGDSAGVTLIGNNYPFRGYVDNFGILARDTVAQLKFLGNTSDTVVVLGAAARPFFGKLTTQSLDTLRAMKSLPWRVEQDQVYIDSLARFIPNPGSRFVFNNGGFVFQRGGRLVAIGTNSDSIYFSRWSSGNFYGLVFLNPYQPSGAFPPPAPIDTSVVVRVRISDVNTWSVCVTNGCGALAANDRHVLLVDSVRIRQVASSAVIMNAPNSRLSRTIIDTTGTPTSGFAALIVGNGALAESTTVRRSGQTGVYMPGAGVLRQIDIINSLSYGLYVSNSGAVLDSVLVAGAGGPSGIYVDAANASLTKFKVTGSISAGVRIANNNVTFTNCDVTSSATHGFELLANYSGVVISNCNIGGSFTLNEQNLGQGVFNPTGTNSVNASGNWWGIDPNTGGNYVPTNGGINGYSGNVNVSSPLPSKRP